MIIKNGKLRKKYLPIWGILFGDYDPKQQNIFALQQNREFSPFQKWRSFSNLRSKKRGLAGFLNSSFKKYQIYFVKNRKIRVPEFTGNSGILRKFLKAFPLCFSKTPFKSESHLWIKFTERICHFEFSFDSLKISSLTTEVCPWPWIRLNSATEASYGFLIKNNIPFAAGKICLFKIWAFWKRVSPLEGTVNSPRNPPFLSALSWIFNFIWNMSLGNIWGWFNS